MSDDTTATIQAAMAEAGISESATAEAPETEVVATEAPTAEAEKTDEPDDETELKSLEEELVTKDQRLRNGHISTSRHQAVLTRARRRFEAERAELSKKYDSLKQYEHPDTANRIQAAMLAESDPVAFLKVLGAIPHYKSLLDQQIEEAIKSRATAQPDEQAPGPNKLNDDGTVVYDAEGAQKLLDFHLRKAQADFDKKIEALRGDLKPIQDERQNQQDLAAAIQRQTPVLENARQNWAGFKEHEAEIRAEMEKEFPRLSLEGAYIRVVTPKLRGDRESIRTELMKEINSKSKAVSGIRPSLPSATTEPAGNSGTPDTEAIVREKYRELAAQQR